MTKAFSLIELLVVVAIIAILAAVAIPTYRQYQVRVAIEKAYMLLQQTAYNAVMTYQRTGAFPSSVTFVNGYSYPGFVAWYNAPATNLPYAIQGTSFSVYNFLYVTSTLQGGPDNKGIALGVTIAGLTGYIPGYTDPANAGGAGNTAGNTLYWVVRDVNGTIVSECGSWGSAYTAQVIPFNYQPSSCTCLNSANFFTTGVC